MSIPVSAGDLFMFCKALEKLISTLKNEAVEGFKTFNKTYKRFLKLFQKLTEFIQQKALQGDPDIKRSLRHSKRLLLRFFSRISKFKPHLGRNRVRGSLINAVAKIKWVRHTDMLKELRQDLDRELAILYLLIATKRELQDMPPITQNRTEYIVILVTQPPIHSYGVVSDKLYTPPDEPGVIDWNSTDPGTIPPMLPSLHFRRHFALCLIPQEVWSCQDKTLAEKFQGQLFWDYYGDDTNYSRGTVWPSDRIRNINAIEDLGVALSGEDAANLCTEYYIGLRDKLKWTYFNIWWNAADFALSLACLLVAARSAETCQKIMRRLTKLRNVEVLRPRKQGCRTSAGAGLALFAGAVALTAVTGGLAAPFAMPAAAGGLGCLGGSVATHDALKNGGQGRLELRETAIAKMGQSFPRLRELFN